MKQIEVFEAKDGRWFTSQEKCLAYEEQLKNDSANRVQQLAAKIRRNKQTMLSYRNKYYEEILHKYKKSCTTKMNIKERLEIIQEYVYAKSRLDEGIKIVNEQQDLLRTLKNSKE